MRIQRHHRRRLTTLAAVLAAFLLPGSARADGTLLSAPVPWWYLEENRQAGILAWDAASGIETLTLQPGLAGNARDFVWIVPAPGDPEVTAADSGLVVQALQATSRVVRSRDHSWSCDRDDGGIATPAGGVETVFAALVGDYDVAVLRTDEAGALADTLEAWGYLTDANRDGVTAALQDYVDRGWAFVTARVDSAVAPLPPDRSWLPGSALTPLTLTFAAEAPVYPMRLSALSAAAKTPVELVVVADHRWTFPGAKTIYANRVDPGELAELERAWPLFAARLAPGCFVTRLTRDMSPVDMTEDIVLEQAPDDDEFRVVRTSGFPWTALLFVVPMVTWLVRRRRPA